MGLEASFTRDLAGRLPVSPKSGEEALRTVEAIYATPDDIVQAARKIAGE